MRAILVIVVLVLLMAWAGWLVFDFDGNTASVEVRPDEVRQDTDTFFDRASETLEGDGAAVPPQDSMITP